MSCTSTAGNPIPGHVAPLPVAAGSPLICTGSLSYSTVSYSVAGLAAQIPLLVGYRVFLADFAQREAIGLTMRECVAVDAVVHVAIGAGVAAREAGIGGVVPRTVDGHNVGDEGVGTALDAVVQ